MIIPSFPILIQYPCIVTVQRVEITCMNIIDMLMMDEVLFHAWCLRFLYVHLVWTFIYVLLVEVVGLVEVAGRD